MSRPTREKAKLLFEIENYRGDGIAVTLFYESKMTEAIALVVDARKRQERPRSEQGSGGQHRPHEREQAEHLLIGSSVPYKQAFWPRLVAIFSQYSGKNWKFAEKLAVLTPKQPIFSCFFLMKPIDNFYSFKYTIPELGKFTTTRRPGQTAGTAAPQATETPGHR